MEIEKIKVKIALSALQSRVADYTINDNCNYEFERAYLLGKISFAYSLGIIGIKEMQSMRSLILNASIKEV